MTQNYISWCWLSPSQFFGFLSNSAIFLAYGVQEVTIIVNQAGNLAYRKEVVTSNCRRQMTERIDDMIVHTLPFLLPKTSMVHDLAENLSKQVTLTPGGTGKIRIFEISKDGRTQREFTGSEMIGNIPDPVELYAEVYIYTRCISVFSLIVCSGNS